MARLTKDQRLSVKQETFNQLNPAVPLSTLHVSKLIKRSWLMTRKVLGELESEGKVKKFESKTEKKTTEYWSPA
jgi:hypothetical protein